METPVHCLIRRGAALTLRTDKAAKFITQNLDKVKNGAVSLPMPEGFPARMINPDGTFGIPSKIKLVPSGNGVKTAYPEF